ncbi:MAG: hypothetical protein ACOC00_06645, partial [Halothiobacillaceae bacterium]
DPGELFEQILLERCQLHARAPGPGTCRAKHSMKWLIDRDANQKRPAPEAPVHQFFSARIKIPCLHHHSMD